MTTVAAPLGAATARTRLAPVRDRRTLLAAFLIVAVVLVSHGHNMLHYPYLEDDEGTYSSQAWAVFHLGRLAPYTYWYDHAPGGWIQIGLWDLLSAPLRLGYALAADRVLMLLFQIGSALLVFAIGRKATGKRWVGLFAALAFSLSPWGIYYHRRILLDNVATFWMLASLWLLVGKPRLRQLWLSAVAAAFAVLSKEVAIAIVPALVLLAACQTPKSTRVFGVVGWCAGFAALCSLYPLMALLKGEFFSAGTTLGGSRPHVSLLCALQFQAGRKGDFWPFAGQWAHAEPLLVLGGTAAAIGLVVLGWRKPVRLCVGLIVVLLWLFLGRGAVIDFYLVPLLPFLALALALGISAAADASAARMPIVRAVLVGLALFACGSVAVTHALRAKGDTALAALYTGDPVSGQNQAVAWIRRRLPPDSKLVIDQYMWRDLHVDPNGPQFRNADYYWKVGQDPAIQAKVFDDDWRKVDYVITTPQLISDTERNGLRIVVPALEHSLSVATFNTGWFVDVRRVDPQIARQSEFGSPHVASTPSCMRSTA